MSIIANLEQCAKYISKGVMYPDYTPSFTVRGEDYNRQYRSVFGPYFNIKGLNHSAQGSGENRAMVARMIAIRKHGCEDAGSCHLCTSVPERFKNLDDYLKYKQTCLKRHLRSSVHRFKKWLYARVKFGDVNDVHKAWVLKANAKRRLRVRVYNRCSDLGDDRGDDLAHVQFKGKPGELLEQGKRRGTGDLGVNRTHATAFAFSAFKDAMEGEYSYGNYTFRFAASPSIEILQDIFDRMSSIPAGHVYFVYFSDDGVLGVNTREGLAWYNTDLKQCDGSHFTPFLDLVESILTHNDGVSHPYSKAISRAYSYLSRSMLVRNAYNYKEKVLYEFTSKRMYSGFAGTTITNNFANLFIGFCMQRRVPNPGELSRDCFIKQFELAAADAGYICHLQICSRFEDLQFLKHSPVLASSGSYIPCMNLGTFFRGFGTFYGDLPATGPYASSAAAFVSDVVVSRLNWGNHGVNHAFKHLIINHSVEFRETAAYGAAFYSKQQGSDNTFIPLCSLCVRYRCTVTELEDLISVISSSRVGDAIENSLVQRIHSKDYG